LSRLVARDPDGKQIWQTIGTADAMAIEQARDLARAAIRTIKNGTPTSEAGNGATVQAVAELWLERHVRKNGFRTAHESERIVAKYIVPAFGDRPIAEVRRKDVAALLDRIEDENGRSMADTVLKVYRAISRWHEQRDEDFLPVLTAGMRRVSKTEGRRTRFLDDDEIRKVWNAGATSYTHAMFGAFVKLALLTGQRHDKIQRMRWQDIKDGVWTIPTAPREKGTAGKLKLPKLALDVINAQPRFIGNPHVFAGKNHAATAILSSGQYKKAFLKASGTSGWRPHDLRRTAKSLMSRAKVPSEISERVLGHVRPDMEMTYDQYDYQSEKADAVAKLAALIEQIVLG
jgi:integrase